jgi:hypothetical protein
MSDEDEPVSATPGSMVEHIQKYKDYIQDLKQGKSSGISAAFGKANDLLPPDVMAVALTAVPEKAATSTELNSVVFADENDRAALRNAVEGLILSCADQLAEFLGVEVISESGENSEVINVFMEDGERKFMLANLDVVDQAWFDQNRQDISVEAVAAEFEQEELFETAEQSIDIVELIIPDARGNHLWTVAYRDREIAEIVMADGSQISKAHGRNEFVYVDRADKSLRSDVFILSALMVDPSTGNIFGEVNDGAINMAFLNNGWHIRQYRQEAGQSGQSQSQEHSYVREPPKGTARAVLVEVQNLELDVESGEVSYESLDSAATIKLKSRQIR